MSAAPITPEMTPGVRVLRRGRRCLAWGMAMMGLVVLLALQGCGTTLDVSALKPGKKLDERASIDGIMGPQERRLKQVAWEKRKRELTAGRTPEEKAALAELAKAEKLLEAGVFAKAEMAAKKIAKSRRWNGLNWAERAGDALRTGTGTSYDPMYSEFGDPIEEDALFLIAEAQFAQQEYSWAQDSYDRLLEKYPSSRHLDTVTRRMFDIARKWMNFPRADEKGDVQLASGELLKTNPREGQRGFRKPAFINLIDGSKPVFDTGGRALQALQSIWLNDANGPLADDALMLTANYHLQVGDFVEAARVYQLLREQYPDSPHFKDAYVLESHVRLAAYEGPGYDAKGLEESKSLKESSLQLFPNLDSHQRAMLEQELSNIAVAEERREWHKVEFYQSKGDDASVALHCNKILKRFPNSRYAKPARQELARIANQRRQGSRGFSLLRNGTDAAYTPVLDGLTSRRSPPSASPQQPSDSGRARLSADLDAPKSKPQKPPSFFRRFLRRAESDPKLKPVDKQAQADNNATTDDDSGRATLR